MVHHDRPETGHVLTIAPELRYSLDSYHEAAIVYRDRVFVICTEGVGQEVTDDKPLASGFGETMTRREGIALLADGTERETRPLESWVRNHNDRLQGNFHLWKRNLDLARDDLHEAECGDTFPTADDAAAHAVHCAYCNADDEAWDAPAEPTLLAAY